MYLSSTQMCESLLVPGPSGNPRQIFIRGIGKEDIQVSWTIQLQNLFQLFHVQVGSGKQKTTERKKKKKQVESLVNEDFISAFSKFDKLQTAFLAKKQFMYLCHSVENSSELCFC